MIAFQIYVLHVASAQCPPSNGFIFNQINIWFASSGQCDKLNCIPIANVLAFAGNALLARNTSLLYWFSCSLMCIVTVNGFQSIVILYFYFFPQYFWLNCHRFVQIWHVPIHLLTTTSIQVVWFCCFWCNAIIVEFHHWHIYWYARENDQWRFI